MADKGKRHHNDAADEFDDGMPDDKTETGRRIRSYRRKLRRLTSELSLAEARERREIASDLHDHIGQALAYVSQKVSVLQGNAVFSGMEEDFTEILSILQQTLAYTREMTVAISPPVLYELGLASAIDWLADRAKHRHDLTVRSSQTGRPKEVSEAIKVFIFKALQELITNVAKHARATNVTLHTNWHGESIEISVSDDGCGFETPGSADDLTDTCCFGLFSIRERLSYIGGDISIDSTPGNGTRVTINTPYQLPGEDEHD